MNNKILLGLPALLMISPLSLGADQKISISNNINFEVSSDNCEAEAFEKFLEQGMTYEKSEILSTDLCKKSIQLAKKEKEDAKKAKNTYKIKVGISGMNGGNSKHFKSDLGATYKRVKGKNQFDVFVEYSSYDDSEDKQEEKFYTGAEVSQLVSRGYDIAVFGNMNYLKDTQQDIDSRERAELGFSKDFCDSFLSGKTHCRSKTALGGQRERKAGEESEDITVSQELIFSHKTKKGVETDLSTKYTAPTDDMNDYDVNFIASVMYPLSKSTGLSISLKHVFDHGEENDELRNTTNYSLQYTAKFGK